MVLPLLLSFLLAVAASTADFKCKDAKGNDVDWFAGYKIPRTDADNLTPRAKGKNPRDGTTIVYTDPNTPQWVESPASVASSSGHHVAETLQVMYDNLGGENFNIIYNDEWPNGSWTEEYGHTKGIVAFTPTTGFWLIHSVPKFSNATAYYYPHSGEMYGQMFLCVSFKTDQLPTIAKQLYYTEPWIISYHLPDNMAKKIPVLRSIVQERFVTKSPYTSLAHLESDGGKQLMHFGKAGKWGQDLYSAFISQTLKTDIDVQTWLHGDDNLDSNCSIPYHVYNILDIKLPGGVRFDTYADHSKYAISENMNNSWVCIGDINREKSQFRRGGGSMCMKDGGLWKTFSQTESSVYPCHHLAKNKA